MQKTQIALATMCRIALQHSNVHREEHPGFLSFIVLGLKPSWRSNSHAYRCGRPLRLLYACLVRLCMRHMCALPLQLHTTESRRPACHCGVGLPSASGLITPCLHFSMKELNSPALGLSQCQFSWRSCAGRTRVATDLLSSQRGQVSALTLGLNSPHANEICRPHALRELLAFLTDTVHDASGGYLS